MSLSRVLIAEDEDLARDRLVRLVRARQDLELINSCRNGQEAFDLLIEQPVDIALFDIEMPGMSGIELSRRLRDSGSSRPVIVFVTAHARFAVDAFNVRAADYLLKPFDGERFDEAVQAAKERVRAQRAIAQSERIRALMSEAENDDDLAERAPAPAPTCTGRVVVRHEGRMRVIPANQIDWIEAYGRNCVLHSGTQQHRIEGPLWELTHRLGEATFVQVGRSYVINIDRIAELQEMFKGNLIAVLKNGDEVPVSRRFRGRVMEHLAGR